MNIQKEKKVTGDFIANFIKQNDMITMLNNREKKMLNFSYEEKEFSLTECQNPLDQLRYFGSTYYYDLINNILIKLKNNYSKINNTVTLELNLNELNKIELTFINGLKEIDYKNKITLLNNSKIFAQPLEPTVENIQFYLGKGDLWTALDIANYFINKNFSGLSEILLKYMALTYSFNDQTFISESIINYIINNDFTNKTKASLLYVKSMFYLRQHPHFVKNNNKAAEILNDAYSLIEDDDEATFLKIFNRNGYALSLFKNGEYKKSLDIELQLHKDLQKFTHNIEKRNMHSSVILYNIYQCYKVLGEFSLACDVMELLLKIDPNDYNYRYSFINYLVSNNKYEEAMNHLHILEKQKNVNFLSHWNYLAFIKNMDGNYSDSRFLYSKAYYNNFINKDINEYLFNYVTFDEKKVKELSIYNINQLGSLKNELLNIIT